MRLNELFKDAPAIEIDQLSCDSRMPMTNCIFFCIQGIKYDGHNFIDEAIENGAKVIVYSDDIKTDKDVIYIKVNDVLDILNQVSSVFYAYPSLKLENIIVSGNINRLPLIDSLMQIIKIFRNCASINSSGIFYNENTFFSNVPTLTVLDNQKYLAKMVDEGIQTCILEADVLALNQKKLDNVEPACFIYTATNVESSDYQIFNIDYLYVFEKYLQRIPKMTKIILNGDDINYDDLKAACFDDCISYGIENTALDYYATDIVYYKNGLSFVLHYLNQEYNVSSSLIAEGSIYQILALIACLNSLGYPLEDVIKACTYLNSTLGYMEYIDIDQRFNVVVEKANNLISLKRAIAYAKKITDSKHRIIAIFGFSDAIDDDKIIAYCDFINDGIDLLIFTENDISDADIYKIYAKILTRISIQSIIIENRESAISLAIELLNENDTLLILGKGDQKFIYRSLGKENYDGDSALAKKYIIRRMEEENEIS